MRPLPGAHCPRWGGFCHGVYKHTPLICLNKVVLSVEVLSLVLWANPVGHCLRIWGSCRGGITWINNAFVTITVSFFWMFVKIDGAYPGASNILLCIISYPGRVLYYIPRASPVGILKVLPRGHQLGWFPWRLLSKSKKAPLFASQFMAVYSDWLAASYAPILKSAG